MTRPTDIFISSSTRSAISDTSSSSVGKDVRYSNPHFVTGSPLQHRGVGWRLVRTKFPSSLLARIEGNVVLKLAVHRLQQEELEQQQQQQQKQQPQQQQERQEQQHYHRPLDDRSTLTVDSIGGIANDWEMALFAPLAHEQSTVFGRVVEIPHHQHSSDKATVLPASPSSNPILMSHSDVLDCDQRWEEDFPPVQLELEDPLSLLSCPRILSQATFQYLQDHGIPETLRGNRWERCFAIGRDGDSFVSFLDKCAPFRHTLLVIQTSEGEILGGFVTQTWQGQEGYGKRNSYYGTGQSFVFSCRGNPETTQTTTGRAPETQIFKWTGLNDYCQICDVEKAQIAMGGGGNNFGIVVEDCFSRGQTGFCETYGNPPLTSHGFFQVAAMEVYGLVPFFNSFNSSSSTMSSISREVDAFLCQEHGYQCSSE